MMSTTTAGICPICGEPLLPGESAIDALHAECWFNHFIDQVVQLHEYEDAPVVAAPAKRKAIAGVVC